MRQVRLYYEIENTTDWRKVSSSEVERIPQTLNTFMLNLPDWLLDYDELENDKKFEASPPTIKKLSPLTPCGDCGRELDAIRYVDIKRCSTPVNYIQKKCRVCKLYEHPERPNEFICSNQELKVILDPKKANDDK